ncbi:MAG: hypothetical protein K0S09_655 [Sphingobacteriaceae bacterium]|jgi:hypothetical protein|nr:hypothetical protein [Sphingobacteriaceae bacterium]
MKRIVFILLSIFIATSAFAQAPRSKGRERLEAAKAAFINQKLNLTSDEAEQFWPVFNNYQRESELLIKQRAIAKKSGEAYDVELDFKSKMLDLQRRYSQQFYKVLPRSKAIQVFKAERDFRQNLIKELGERHSKGMAVRD